MGPFFEEASKGAVILFFFLIILISDYSLREKIDSKKAWFVAGALFGLFIGLYEAFIEYSPGLYRVIPTLNHVFWTALVSTGIWLSMKSSQEWELAKLFIPYSLISVSHIFWNYHSFLEGVKENELTFGTITWIFVLLAFLFIWRID